MGGLSRWSGHLIDRYGARTPLIAGPIITAAGFALLARPGTGGSYWSTFFPAMAVLGVGMAISVAPLTTAVLRSAGDRYAGVASGINNATARIAGMLAVALLGAIAVGVFGSALRERLDRVAVSPDVRQEIVQQVPKLAEAEVPRQVTGSLRQEVERVLHESFVHGFRVTSLIGAVLAMLSALCALLFVDPRIVDAEGKSS
jgi:MFS family permease